jgi:hypothetical protein
MSAAAPAWKPQINRSEPPPNEGGFLQRPAVRATLRALYLVGGFAVACGAFFVVGFWAALLGCVGEETRGLCVHTAWLVPVLEWPIFVAAVVAPLAGGIASYLKRDPVWLTVGIMAAFVMGGLMALVSTGQTGLLS